MEFVFTPEQEAFREPGGDKLKAWIDACPNPLYSALVFQGGAAWRKRLNDEIAAVLALPDVDKRLESLGSEKPARTPEAFMTLIQGETRRLGDLIRRANITAD